MNARLSLVLLTLACGASIGVAGTWERFRGPQGEGVAQNQNLPITLETSKNLVWKVQVPGLGNSSPIVWNDYVILLSSTTDGSERLLLCLDSKTGKMVWERKFPGQTAKTHKMNSLASSTPVTDGETICSAVWDGTDVTLHAHTIKGEPMWNKNLGEFKSQHGPGASPVIYKDKVFFAHDMDGQAAMYVFDKKTGKQIWTAPREAFRASYSAPQILEKGPNGPEVIITSTTAITSYNPDNGSRNWEWAWTWGPKTKPLRTIASSIERGGMLFACSGDGGGDRQMVALNLPSAPSAKPVQAWDNKKEFPYVPCILSQGANLFFVNDRGFAGCFDSKSGKKVFYERVPEATFTASPVLVDGKIYAASEEGDMFVLAADTKFEILAHNKIGERIRATPAVADGRIFIRGANSLFCYGKRD